MLSGKLLPAHPKPFKDEILTSWLIRLAKANGMKLQTFSRVVFENQNQLWNRDIDRSAFDWLITGLADKTNCTEAEIYNLTLKSYEGVLFNHFSASGILKWILPLNIYHRKRMGYGQQYCHECFKEDEVPYFRKNWRVAFNTFCVKHNIMLNDRCSKCNSPVMFHRSELGRPQLFDGKEMCYCTTCDYDLRRATSQGVEVLDSESFSMFHHLLSSIQETGTTSLDLDYLNILRQFYKLINSSVTGEKLIRFLIKKINLKEHSLTPNHLPMEKASLVQRNQGIQLAVWILFDLSNRVEMLWSQKVIRYNQLLKDFHDCPEWYFNDLRGFNRLV